MVVSKFDRRHVKTCLDNFTAVVFAFKLSNVGIANFDVCRLRLRAAFFAYWRFKVFIVLIVGTSDKVKWELEIGDRGNFYCLAVGENMFINHNVTVVRLTGLGLTGVLLSNNLSLDWPFSRFESCCDLSQIIFEALLRILFATLLRDRNLSWRENWFVSVY